jgi:hypothetical protein
VQSVALKSEFAVAALLRTVSGTLRLLTRAAVAWRKALSQEQAPRPTRS